MTAYGGFEGIHHRKGKSNFIQKMALREREMVRSSSTKPYEEGDPDMEMIKSLKSIQQKSEVKRGPDPD